MLGLGASQEGSIWDRNSYLWYLYHEIIPDPKPPNSTSSEAFGSRLQQPRQIRKLGAMALGLILCSGSSEQKAAVLFDTCRSRPDIIHMENEDLNDILNLMLLFSLQTCHYLEQKLLNCYSTD